ncbi:MAG: hypothetical protein LBK22_08500 [Tannerella sp.]|nr:hypothetical protein [Tannerella sp.]
MHIHRKEMNALTGNKAFPLIFRSIDMDALTGNAYPELRCCKAESPAPEGV